jgi:CheY-like chemotaxis protein
VQSVLGRGSTFRVRLLLPEAPHVLPRVPARRIRAYLGPRRKILIADDDPDHVRLVRDVLHPLGFITFAVSDGPSCLALHDEIMPDLVLLDISMPGMSGLEVASHLRRPNSTTKILMVSGNLHDAARPTPERYDGFLPKPINLRALLERIGETLGLDWVHDMPVPVERAKITPPAEVKLAELRRLARIGYVRGIEAQLAELQQSDHALAPFCAEIAGLLRDFAMPKLIARLDAMVPPP